MSRVTAPITKLSRAMGSSTTPVAGAARPSAHSAGAALMPKYAELLHGRRSSELHDTSARGLTTAHRPTPQPSLANRPKPLMQTFHSTPPSAAAAAAAAATASHIDATVLPSAADLFGRPSSATAGPQVPILPDNYSSAARGPADAPGHGPAAPEVSIVAADPDNVLPGAPLSAMEGISLDSVELKFVHEHAHHPGPPADSQEHSGGMIRDLWKGMVDDVLGPARKTA